MDSSGGRPETDDYDLLTFGEVAARLTEVLAAEAAELEKLRSQPNPDQAAIRSVEQRIERLRAGAQRYSEEQRTNSAFLRRYGSLTATSDDRPQWR
ncbi:hypothetical protein AWC02_07720 [Mycolicibacter engbaekii]|uniref:Acyl-CoA synthase n=1 Tax=Mycolicibacter engbaekii TaxID=188915 RepID=A0A1X1TWL0_9MYCO|nr:hypothetical protein [Mycolicibacter engbaekii]ORV48970.1 hypothetical protein AWC02_07720 [Mycolicibacter engbaekii]